MVRSRRSSMSATKLIRDARLVARLIQAGVDPPVLEITPSAAQELGIDPVTADRLRTDPKELLAVLRPLIGRYAQEQDRTRKTAATRALQVHVDAIKQHARRYGDGIELPIDPFVALVQPAAF